MYHSAIRYAESGFESLEDSLINIKCRSIPKLFCARSNLLYNALQLIKRRTTKMKQPSEISQFLEIAKRTNVAAYSKICITYTHPPWHLNHSWFIKEFAHLPKNTTNIFIG